MKNIFIIILILLISACGNQTIRQDKPQYQGLVQAQNFYRSHDYSRAASSFSQLYNNFKDDEFAVYAADSWLQLRDYQQAGHYLSQVQQSNHTLFKIVQSELYVRSGKYNFNLNEVNGNLRPRYLALKAKIDGHNNNHLNAALALIELSELSSVSDVNNKIISHLAQVPKNTLTTALFNVQISQLQQGWLEATYASLSQDNGAIKQWQTNWHNHPAMQMFNQANHYQNIAVLLPLTGKYKNISKSIQQGMVAALYQDSTNQQQLTFFDTGSNGESFSYAWYGAIESGAEFIIGPLEKNSIAQLVKTNSSTTPVLLLNQLENQDNPNGYYQFSLSKEDEVTNVAMRLIAENKKRIILLAPETKSGKELAQYFDTELSYFGGQVVSNAFYPETINDYTREIKQSLGLNDSKLRAKQLQAIIGEKFKNTPQIRPDVDAIFVIAKPKNARLLKPQLKFFQAENVPVFATSQIQSSTINTSLDKDLNGIKFPQNAFTIDASSIQQDYNFDTIKVGSNKKFFAFGYDVISVYSRLDWMQRMQNQSFPGMSGKLSVDGNGKVHRKLAWAQYKRGAPVLLAPIEPLLTDQN